MQTDCCCNKHTKWTTVIVRVTELEVATAWDTSINYRMCTGCGLFMEARCVHAQGGLFQNCGCSFPYDKNNSLNKCKGSLHETYSLCLMDCIWNILTTTWWWLYSPFLFVFLKSVLHFGGLAIYSMPTNSMSSFNTRLQRSLFVEVLACGPQARTHMLSASSLWLPSKKSVIFKHAAVLHVILKLDVPNHHVQVALWCILVVVWQQV